MKAIKVFIDEREQFKMLNLIEKFNGYGDWANGFCSSHFWRMCDGLCKGGSCRKIG